MDLPHSKRLPALLPARRARDFTIPPRSRWSARVSRGVLHLAFELTVVFIGVSAAFLGDNYRESLERRDQMIQTYSALSQELEDFVVRGQRIHDLRLKAFDAWAASGTFAGTGDSAGLARERPSRAAWDATATSGGLRLINQALFYQLAQHYERVSAQNRHQDGLEALLMQLAVASSHDDRRRVRLVYLEHSRALFREEEENIQMAAPLLAELRRRVTPE